MQEKKTSDKPEAKWVYRFANGKADGGADLRNLLGGKGANLAEMTNIGFPVPPGFTITTDVCTAYYENGRKLPDDLHGEIQASIEVIGKAAEAEFGSTSNPLLVSVRSGARGVDAGNDGYGS